MVKFTKQEIEAEHARRRLEAEKLAPVKRETPHLRSANCIHCNLPYDEALAGRAGLCDDCLMRDD